MRVANDISSQMHHLVSLMSREGDQTLQEQLGVGLSQYKILSTLHEHPRLQQRTIAQMLGQTEASISRQIKLLQQKAMLIAPKNPNNRREHIASLTPKGVRIVEAAEKVLENYHRSFLKGLSTKNQQQFHDLLNTIHRDVCYMQHPGVSDIA